MAHNKNPGAGATARGAGDEDAGKRLVSSPKPNARKATFTAWLSRAHITCDPAGDLVGDMRADRELPALRSLGGLRTYLDAAAPATARCKPRRSHGVDIDGGGHDRRRTARFSPNSQRKRKMTNAK